MIEPDVATEGVVAPRTARGRRSRGRRPESYQAYWCPLCGARNNGSYGSQAPCGYDFHGASLAATIERELAARA